MVSPTTSASRVARVPPRIKEAIEESMANLPDRLRWEIDNFAAGVLMGKAPSLEQHTSALYKAFAPLRKALGGTTTVYRGQPINPPKIERKWLSWTTEPRMAARFTGKRGDQIIEAKVKSSDVVAGILSPHNPDYIEFLVKNRPEYQTRSQKQVPIYYALDMPLNPWFYDDMPENFSDLSDREQLEFSYPGWKRWLKDNGKAVERAGGLVMHSDPPKMNPDEVSPFLGVLMPADVKLPPAIAALDDAKYGRPMPRYMGKVARHLISGLLKTPPKMLRDMRSWVQSNLDRRPTSRYFPFDLDGWRYLSGVRPEDAETILKKKHPRGVRVILSDKKHRFGEARWDDDAWEITIYDTSDLDHALHFVRHEAQHMAQDMLAEITGVSDAGLPKRRIRTPEWGEVDLSKPRFMGPADPHALIDREYQTRLTDSVENYLRFEPHLSPKAYMARDSFFTMLRAFAPKKYRDAVGKFVAEVGRRTTARVASRYMQAGLLDVPPKVVEDVYQWCMERLCSEWLENELPYKKKQIRRKMEGAEGWQRDFQENRLVNLGLVEREAKKWGRAGTSFSGHRDRTWRGYIDVDFSGWRYASEIRTRTGKTSDELAKEMRKDRFFLILKDNEKLGGAWVPSTSHRGWAMEIRTNFNPHDLKTWRSRTQELRKLIVHETGHLAQSYLDLFLNLRVPGEKVPIAGLPGSDLAEPGYDPLGNKLSLYGNPVAEMSGKENHALREVEFYTRLRDDIEDFVRMTKRIPKNAWREALRVWVAEDERSYSDPLRFRVPGEPSRDVRNSDFFKTIKQNRRKWQKAVSLFVDEVGKRISIPSAARVAFRYAATTPLPPSFPKTEIGLMTMDEFLEYRNPQGKFHDTEIWDYDVLRMNRPTESYLGSWTGRPGEPAYSFSGMRNGVKVSRNPDLIAGVIHNGTLYYSDSRDGRNIPDYYIKYGFKGVENVEIRKRKQVKYLSEVLPLISPIAKRNIQEHPNIIQRLIVKGEPMTLRSEDGGRGHAPTLVILNSEDLVVAQASDEWGATLIAVAREYRGRGLGKVIGKRWYELNPSNTSGGFTEAGRENALALWRDRVREFKARGWYSEMIREGRITMDRLREIFSGVKDSKRDLEEFKALYFSGEREPEPTKPTGDILVWSDGDTAVIVYDRAFLEDPDDRFIHGYGFLRHTPQTGTYIFSIEYDRSYAEMTTKALMQVARDGGDDRLYDGDGYSDIVEAENIPGVERDGDYLVLTRDLFPLRQEARKEKRVRKPLDPYDEKFYLLQEQADAKWR